jgi:hypothetical protein
LSAPPSGLWPSLAITAAVIDKVRFMESLCMERARKIIYNISQICILSYFVKLGKLILSLFGKKIIGAYYT